MNRPGFSSGQRGEPAQDVRRPRISKLALRNFRAFPGDEEFVIDLKPEGKNLLLYGENGAGKSSLFIALQQLFAKGIYRPRYDFHEHLNIHTRDEDGHVEVTTTVPGMEAFRWTKDEMHPHVPGVVGEIGESMPGRQESASSAKPSSTTYEDFAKGVYLLDYKTLLRCSFPFEHEDRMDIADVLRLALYDFVLDGESVARRWQRLRVAQMDLHEKLGEAVDEYPRDLIEVSRDLGGRAFTFWVQFEHAIAQWDSPFLVRANAILRGMLQEDVAIEFRTVSNTRPSYAPPYVDLVKRELELFIKYRGNQIRHPGTFLNESRMTALALSLFLSAAELCTANSPIGTRVLVLDDILISLDISHRIPVLKLLQQEFADWQILLFTHDRLWYELAREYTKGSGDWACYELMVMEAPPGTPPRPYLKQGQDHLERARRLLNAPHGDLMAAAVHIRAWFEDLLKRKCEKYNRSVPYYVNPKDYKADRFWEALKADNRPDKGAATKMGQGIIDEVEMVRSNVLNKLSHSGTPNLVKTEVEAALELMPRLKHALD